MSPIRKWPFLSGPCLALAVGWGLHTADLPADACWTGAITVLCAVWWVFEPIPMPATALIPFALFPLTGVLDHREVATSFGHPLILLMLAGSIISTAMEKSGAHRRVALGMVSLVGGSGGRRLILGFLLASALLSMWISNTATVVMLLPVALAVLESAPEDRRLAVPLLLAVTYGASVGGNGTPIGTPPNLIFLGQYEQQTGQSISFFQWMKIGLPVVAIMLPIVWLWLTRRLRGASQLLLPELGAWRPAERRVLIVFALTALAWITRSEPYGGWSGLLGSLGAWSGLLEVAGEAGDSTVALAAVAVLFILPSGEGGRARLLDWETAVKIPWGVFLMIGGGMAIGQAFRESQLSLYVGSCLEPLATLPPVLLIVCLCLIGTFLTEITSNTAVANVMLPVLAATGESAGVDPLWLMVPATLGLNCAFMLPVATAPNAIIFGTGRVSTATMVREGFVLNLLATGVITVVTYLLLWR